MMKFYMVNELIYQLIAVLCQEPSAIIRLLLEQKTFRPGAPASPVTPGEWRLHDHFLTKHGATWHCCDGNKRGSYSTRMVSDDDEHDDI